MLTIATVSIALAVSAMVLDTTAHFRRRRTDRQNRLERAWWRADR